MEEPARLNTHLRLQPTSQPNMGLKFLLWIGWILAQTPTVNSQCYSEIQTSTITKSHFWEEDVINMGELMESLLDYIRLDGSKFGSWTME